MIKMDCPECKTADSLTLAFGYNDDDELETAVKAKACACPDVDDYDEIRDTLANWLRNTYPYKIQGEWYE
jgi:hypothetical protein